MSQEQTVSEEVEERSVTPFELFFDLVFVFAFTQVTALLAKDPTLETFAKGALIMAALWWAWSAYAWLGSSLHLEEGATRIIMCVVMGAMLIVGLAEPHAFDSDAWVFGVAYLVVRSLHIALYLVAARVSTDLLGAVLRLAPTALAAAILILVSAAFPQEIRPWIWLVALAIDFLGPLLIANDGWQIAVEHFVERHRLILIIALGESIVAVGIGAESADLTAPVIAAALLAITLTVTLWWTYFDIASAVSERVLGRAEPGPAQMHMARDGFSYLHYPMVTGIIFMALGLKKTLEHTDEHLKLLVAVALAGGVALYLLAHVLFRLRLVRSVGWPRVVAIIALIAIIPLSGGMSALLFLTLTVAIMVALIAFEAVTNAEARRRFLAAG